MLERLWETGSKQMAYVLEMSNATKIFCYEVQKTTEGIFGIRIPIHFKTFLLGETDLLKGIAHKKLYQTIMIAAKKTITRHWLQPDPPPTREWVDTVNDIYIMERITSSLNLQKDKSIKIWSKWLSYMKQKQQNFRYVLG